MSSLIEHCVYCKKIQRITYPQLDLKLKKKKTKDVTKRETDVDIDVEREKNDHGVAIILQMLWTTFYQSCRYELKGFPEFTQLIEENDVPGHITQI